MAIFCLTGFPKRSFQLYFFRLLNNGAHVEKSLQFSTTKFISAKKDDKPIKYSTNKAAKMEIAEVIGLKSKTNQSPYTRYIILISFVTLLVYFCILREENDIDEILKGEVLVTEEQQLLDLHLKLVYCMQNNLPTTAIKAKIEELESKKPKKPVFRM